MEKITGKVFAFMMVTMILFAGQLMADQVTEVCLCRKSPQGETDVEKCLRNCQNYCHITHTKAKNMIETNQICLCRVASQGKHDVESCMRSCKSYCHIDTTS
uniref:Uncharacterized protein n=1 Tax=Nicotiana tabacum TaxID=4097 RepID=A0A1S4D5S4_TOBAC|nr:PREDICTED: uncharacterized protein LOC107826331 [Nicotiana tabacum]XP_033516137.1 uncharacterized protein LOC117280531 [Nicotiana tomentosiformis]